jgi:hypothetical protein
LGGIPQDKGRLWLWRKLASFLAGANLLPLTRSISRLTGSWVAGSLSPLSYKIIYLSTEFSNCFAPPSYPDIVNNAFLFGSVEPGAILKGFVYFQKPPNYQKRVILRVEYRIDNETKKVSFPFEVQK